MLAAADSATTSCRAPATLADMLGVRVTRLCRAVCGDAGAFDAARRHRGACCRARALSRRLVHSRADAHRRTAPSGFRFAWNCLVGVPLWCRPSCTKASTTSITPRPITAPRTIPEYLPLALMKPWTLPVFLIAAALAPIGMLIRFAILAPLSLVWPKLRTLVVQRYSGLQINPSFRRPAPEGEFARDWRWQETACSIWAIALDRAHRDRRRAAARFPDFPRRRRRRHVPQPGPHAGRAPVGE